jgi:hypothetical protein
MTVPNGVAVVASAVSLVVVGFTMGSAYAKRGYGRRSLQSALDRVRAALSSIHLDAVLLTPAKPRLGDQVRINFQITSKLPVPVEVWLGADIPYGPDKYFYDVAQDKEVSIQPGQHIYSRYLTLAFPLTAGPWFMNAGVWVGKRSDPELSLRLMLRVVDIAIE